ncbi:hypothetical protein LPJ61_001011 [Coemansia biformis]|uniref:GRIP domain-containing protein n=1 Tax=Coemansia biformis TaxID=1286918 RepID=A0A9W7YG04_9FUNG|nr:hypothetical protein LPJ61_001011 [Coemansia biformis]
MPTNQELQKRVDVLQQQLRKAGDHLKRLASENSSLTEEVERLTGRESQLLSQAQELAASADDSGVEIAHTVNDDAGGAMLRDWERAAGEWASQLGLVPGSEAEGPAILRSIQAHIDASIPGSSESAGAEQLTREVAQLRLDAAQEAESKQGLEEKLAQMEDRLQAFEAGETELVRALDGLADSDGIPDTVPESLRPGLERVRLVLRQPRPADSQEAGAKDNREEISRLGAELEATKAELQEASAAREELGRDYDLLLGRIGTMRDALKAKMNAESDELKRLRVAAAAAAEALARHEKESERQGAAAQAQRKEFDDVRQALWESQEDASRARLDHKDAVDEYERQIADLSTRLGAAEDQLASDAAQHTRLEGRIEQLQGELNQALNAESQWVEEREVHVVTIQNLQGALETLQESKDADVDIAVEKLREELRAAAAAQRAAEGRADQAEGRLRRVELSGATAEQCQKKIADQTAELERLRHEVAVLKDHLNESMRRLREESNEFNLDKRVITNLIVGFLALPYGDSKRYEILQLMSSILQFTEEQQAKAGLIRKAGRRAQPQPSSGARTPDTGTPSSDTKDSFSDQWISFLLRESSSARAGHT